MNVKKLPSCDNEKSGGKTNSVKDGAHKEIWYIIQVAFQINDENIIYFFIYFYYFLFIYSTYIINNNTNLNLLDENMEETLKINLKNF